MDWIYSKFETDLPTIDDFMISELPMHHKLFSVSDNVGCSVGYIPPRRMPSAKGSFGLFDPKHNYSESVDSLYSSSMESEMDYLLPTCMKNNRNNNCGSGDVFESYRENDDEWEDIFDGVLKELESDTCSEFSDRSYVDARNYIQVRLGQSPFLERRFNSDYEEVEPLWRKDPGLAFNKSLRKYLCWPEENKKNKHASLNQPALNTGFKLKKKIERRKRFCKVKNPVDTSPCGDPHIDNNGGSDGISDTSDSGTDFKPNTHKQINNKQTTAKKETLNENESDSDYRTYSDTSSEKLDVNLLKPKTDDAESLRELLHAVAEKAEHISSKAEHIFSKLSANQDEGDCIRKDMQKSYTGIHTNPPKILPFGMNNRNSHVKKSKCIKPTKPNQGHLQENDCDQLVEKRTDIGENHKNRKLSGTKQATILSDSKEILVDKTKDQRDRYLRVRDRVPVILVNSETQVDSSNLCPCSFLSQTLARSLGKKEGELENFKDLLEQAQTSLCKSEDAVEVRIDTLITCCTFWKSSVLTFYQTMPGFN